MYSPSIERLIENFQKLPTIGHKTAQRLAFHIIESKNKDVQEFINSIVDAKRNLKQCEQCFNISDTNPCEICSSERRNKKQICVVEDVRDLLAMERTNEFQGVYHVLHGLISPLKDIGPDDLTLKQLLTRVIKNEVKEVIVATNPNVEGEATAMYISKLLKPYEVKVTRIAHGIPIGGDLEYTDEITLTKALDGRTEIE